MRRNLPQSPAALDEVNKILNQSFNLMKIPHFSLFGGPISKVPFIGSHSSHGNFKGDRGEKIQL